MLQQIGINGTDCLDHIRLKIRMGIKAHRACERVGRLNPIQRRRAIMLLERIAFNRLLPAFIPRIIKTVRR